MNTLTSHSIENPFGKPDTCARFAIDDVTDPFSLNEIMVVGQRYTLGFWVKSDTDCALRICGKVFDVTSKWKQQVMVFEAEKEELDFEFLNATTYYIYHPKLEIGNKATDWSPSPEDAEDRIDNVDEALHQTIIEQTTTITNTCSSLILEALESYVETNDYETFKSEVAAQLSVMSDKITIALTESTDKVDDVGDDLQSTKDIWAKYFEFTKYGLVIKSGENTMQLEIDNDMISFTKNGVRFGWWDGVNFHTGNIMVDVNERAQFGNFAFVPRSDGSLMFLRVGVNDSSNIVGEAVVGKAILL